jgi:peptidoglycan/LPS O-acetylase OafA/YrhL
MRTQPKLVYYPYFDYLRIVLASIVMFVHEGLITWAKGGALAVDVFFALSGWLIGGILLQISSKDLPRFYFNRAIRIWIPYFITFILLITVSVIKKEPITTKWMEFVFYKLTFVYNLFGPPQLAEHIKDMPLAGTGNHFWSVNAEEQFYLLAPLLIVLIPKIGRSIGFWIFMSAITWYFDLYAPMAFGVLAAVVHSRYPHFYSKVGWRLCCLSLFTASSIGMAVASENYRLLSPIFSISLVLLLAVKGEATPIGKFLGGISYPLYLNHWIGIFFCNWVLAPFGLKTSMVRWVLATIVNYAIASFLYWFVDRKLAAQRNHLFTEFRGKIVICAAYTITLIGIVVGLMITT